MIDLMQKNWEWGEFQPGGQFGEQGVSDKIENFKD